MLGERIVLNKYTDDDGYLIAMEPGKDFPIEVKRIFYISGVKENVARANHAAINACFVFVVLNGCVKISLNDGISEEKHFLKKGVEVLFVRENIWIKVDEFLDDNSVLLVFSNKSYDECEYENDYANYIVRRENDNEICNNRSK